MRVVVDAASREAKCPICQRHLSLRFIEEHVDDHVNGDYGEKHVPDLTVQLQAVFTWDERAKVEGGGAS
jgi:hypothetical protein